MRRSEVQVKGVEVSHEGEYMMWSGVGWVEEDRTRWREGGLFMEAD